MVLALRLIVLYIFFILISMCMYFVILSFLFIKDQRFYSCSWFCVKICFGEQGLSVKRKFNSNDTV